MFLIFIPIMMAMTGILIAFLCFIGMCLIIIGCTGIAMNKIHSKQMKIENSVLGAVINKTSLIFGIIFVLFPSGYVLFRIIFILL